MNKIRVCMVMLVLTCLGAQGRAAEPPAGDGERLTVILARTAITVSGKEIEDAVIVLADGKIHSIGAKLEYPLNARVIDARDRVVMPGLINPRTRYGLPPYNRGEVHANWTVADEFQPSADALAELVRAGYTTIGLCPAGAGIPGRALVVHTAGARDERVLQSPAYLRVTADARVFRAALERAQGEIDKVAKAREEFEKKQEQERQAGEAKRMEAEKNTPAASQPESGGGAKSQPAAAPASQPQPEFKAPPIDPAVQALVDLLQKKPGIVALIEVGGASEYLHMLEVLERFPIAHRIFARNYVQSDLAYVLEQLGEKKPQIILQPLIGRAPYSAERIHLVQQISGVGCEVSLTPTADSEEEHGRMFARTAELVREGWSREAALRALTLHPARLLGLDPQLGSLEKGKRADLIFLDGDPFSPATHVREVMIGGAFVYPEGAAQRYGGLMTAEGRP